MKIRYILAVVLVLISLGQFTSAEMLFDQAMDELEDTPLVRTALDDTPIDPNSFTIEIHPANEIKILGSRNVPGGYVLKIFSSAPLVKYDDRLFRFHQSGEAEFFVPEDRHQKVRLL
jgi:hypothetical protein